jgi:excisionase family DNA binding protein
MATNTGNFKTEEDRIDKLTHGLNRLFELYADLFSDEKTKVVSLYYTLEETAQRLRKSKKTIMRRVKEGLLKVHRMKNQRPLFLKKDIDEYYKD